MVPYDNHNDYVDDDDHDEDEMAEVNAMESM